MAIFRLGKRIGPFDIRGGISRGDFKSSAYSKTDRDSRFKRQANTENTIGRFRAAMASAEGYARPARFAIKLSVPANLRTLLANAQNTSYREGSIGKNTPVGLSSVKNPKGDTMLDLAAQMGTQMNIHCDSVSMPGKDLVTQKKQYGNEPEVDMVVGHQYAGTINASFYADKYLRERQFFEAWQKMCVGEHTHKAKYYDELLNYCNPEFETSIRQNAMENLLFINDKDQNVLPNLVNSLVSYKWQFSKFGKDKIRLLLKMQ